MKFVGEAVREHMLQSGNYEQKLVVIGIAVLGRIANHKAIDKTALSIDQVEQVLVCVVSISWPAFVAYLSPLCLECYNHPQSHSSQAWPAVTLDWSDLIAVVMLQTVLPETNDNKKLSYCWETVRRESMPRIAEMDVEMTT